MRAGGAVLWLPLCGCLLPSPWRFLVAPPRTHPASSLPCSPHHLLFLPILSAAFFIWFIIGVLTMAFLVLTVVFHKRIFSPIPVRGWFRYRAPAGK